MANANDILISVQTINLTKKQCEDKIRKSVVKYAYKYVVRKQINMIQYVQIINRATTKLSDKYQLNKSIIKQTVLKFIIHVLAKATHNKKSASLMKVKQEDI